ncbi:MAG: CBS domain-containing protein [Candidatus Heimdallarchaeota archaeon]|nr:CBS domain-containing protein [Candidatus Heimdallarchaeota archaeon]
MSIKTFEKEDPVTSVMTKGVLYVESSKTLREAIIVMADFDIGSLIVANNGEPKGIITSKDIMKILAKKEDVDKILVKDVMQSPLIKIASFETISTALIKMSEQKINHLIVVDGDKIIGMVNPINLLA